MDKVKLKRFGRTLRFMQKHFKKEDIILDLGETNELSDYLRQQGSFKVQNTSGQDLDVDFSIVKDFKNITAFEIFEHMFAPFNLLSEAKGKLITSVPLRLWFAPEYWNDNDRYDCHYHEFSVRQFNHLLERTGWRIKDSELWKSYDKKIGIRPLLRRFFPRYYIVFAEK
ncbi:MAG TPA: hypothetical protein PK719_04455 [Bacteroidales bacterium]|jgi:hypothetical protein|nr:methyltransferase [Bacteroidales bacterium]OQB62990.1 MAG: hypothetical protein BWX96_01204 [Bacteroidetes bacterium ADurb.Bin145]NMD03816.1 methyltransferase [Bacteroidales bacterium]HOU01554.1 hypothetical protein [Bacteroidales bacterium]HQG62884.1 hypothetical protein [Bacteroidales bacterium]